MFNKRPHAQIEVLPGYFDERNLASRLTFAAICDFSCSMKEHAKRLPDAWRGMVDRLNERTQTRQRVMMACCAFDHRIAFQDYAPTTYFGEAAIEFAGGGETHLAAALLATIERTNACRKQIAAAGVTCNRSLIAVITDGQATDAAKLPEAIRQIDQAEQRREMDFVIIAPSVDDIDHLRQLFGKEPIPLGELNYDTVFRGFGDSMSIASRSMAGAEPDGRTLIANSLDAIERGTLLAGPDSGKRLLKPWS